MKKIITILILLLFGTLPTNSLSAQTANADTSLSISGLWQAEKTDPNSLSGGFYYVFFPSGNLIILPSEKNFDAAMTATYLFDNSVYPYHLTIKINDMEPMYCLVEKLDDQTISILRCKKNDFIYSPVFDPSQAKWKRR